MTNKLNNTSCIFCKIINKEIPARIVYENKDVIAFLDIFPTDYGHTLIIPKKHTDSFLTATDNQLAAINVAAKKVAEGIQNALKPLGFNIVANVNRMAYQVVDHYHVHVIPKYTRETGYILVKNPPKNNLENLDDIATKIKNNI